MCLLTCLHPLCRCVLCMLTYLQRANERCVFMCLMCFRASVLSVLAYSTAWRGHMLACCVCTRDCMFCMLTRWLALHACFAQMFYVLTCWRNWCVCLVYLLYMSKIKFKNCYIKIFVDIVTLNMFFIYILIKI